MHQAFSKATWQLPKEGVLRSRIVQRTTGPRTTMIDRPHQAFSKATWQLPKEGVLRSRIVQRTTGPRTTMIEMKG